MSAWTEGGKPVPWPDGEVAGVPTSTSGHLPRVSCICCSHSEPADLEMSWSWLERRYVWSCRDATWCSYRADGNRRARAAHPSGGA